MTSGTDATQVVAGHLTPAELASRHKSVISDISTNPTLAPSYKTQLLNWLSTNNPSTLATSNIGHTNPELASMRIYTGVQEIANSLSTSTNPAVTSGGLTLDINAIYSTPGNTVLTQADRFVDIGIKATNNVTTTGFEGYAIGTGFDNTFAQNNLKDQPKDKVNKPTKNQKNRLPVHGEKQGKFQTNIPLENSQQQIDTRRRPDLGRYNR